MSQPSFSGYRKGLALPTLSLLLSICLLGVSGRAQAQAKDLRVAAASDLQPVMPVFAEAYEKETGVKLAVTFGSSSSLATQILNGAPFDCFFGADFLFPEKVVAAGLADGSAPVEYASGTLVLWARKDLPGKLSMERLEDPSVTHIAIGDEFHAPYGRAAYAALRGLKIYEKVQKKLVVGENIAQTAQFVESGNAQMGFISLTTASSSKLQAAGQYVIVPKVYPKIEQYAVVMKKSPHLAEARAFVEWVRSPKVQENMTKFGLEPVR